MDDKLPFEKREWKVLVKRESETDPRHGCVPEERPMEQLTQYGVINLNKPSGPSSHQVTDYVKRIFGVPHAGHGGTLDPLVTGVLPIALARATRIVQALLSAGKEYVVLMHVHKDLSEGVLRDGLEKFVGKITQVPPVRSAVKRQERTREVYYLKILEIDGKDVLFRVGCQAGTYIRKLAHDAGKTLGCGAHMAQLVRTKAGPFSEGEWRSLQDVRDAYEFWKEGDEKEIRKVVVPFERAVAHLAKVWVHDSAVGNLCHGSSLAVPGIAKLHAGIEKGEMVAVMTLKGELVCLGKAVMSGEEMRKADRGLAVVCEKVFMDRTVYPRMTTSR